MANEMQRRDAQMAILYDLRLMINGSEKEQYMKEELLDLLDTTAAAIDKE